MEDWFDTDPDQVFRTINEGKLVFLETPPEKPVHHHHNTLVIQPESLRTGWVKLYQCHENLDPFPSAQVVYNRDRVRNLKITDTRNIQNAWVEEKASVQLKNIQEHARLCVEAESKILTRDPQGIFTMKNGPFMRKFLDGYFPMHVSMDIKIPEELRYLGVHPAARKGFEVVQNEDTIHLDTWFEGKLYTRFYFMEKSRLPQD